MTQLEDKIYLDNIVFGDNNPERKAWSCLGQTCSRSLIVFLSQLFVDLLIIFGCFCIRLSETCDESTVWVEILCTAARYILLSASLWTKSFLQKIESLFPWLVPPKLKYRNWFTNGWTLEHFNQILTKITFSINNPNLFTMFYKKKSKILSLYKE